MSLKNTYERIHFIGIGGSGMFPLASISLERGLKISGSDSTKSQNTENLSSKGAKIFYEQSSDNISDDVDLVVYSGAIKENNPEIVSAKNKNIKIMKRSEFLGYITDDYKLIAIAGSHGKTTTSSMITQILIDCNYDPTSIIGAYFDKIHGNGVLGHSDIAVCEACEYLDSFLDLNPYIGIILNVDNDHLDYFKTIENEKKSFLKFAEKCKFVVINKDDKNAFEISKSLDNQKVRYFSLNDNEANFSAKNISFDENMCASFDLLKNGNTIKKVNLKVNSRHNILNSLASFCACDILGVNINEIEKSLESFKGANRRFQFIGKFNGVSLFDDYAHHPTEIESTLNTAKKMKYSRVIAVFQPHTFSRTYILLNEFAKALSLCDKVIITDILPVRETNTYGISSEDLANKIPNAVVIKDFNKIAEYLKDITKDGDIVLTIGAGNIYSYIPAISNALKEK